MPLHGKIVVIKRSGGDGTEFPLTATCLFGRKPDCDIRIQLPQVSKEHCRIDLNENKEVILTNLSLVNPTRVNGEVLQQSERLKHGDVITVIDRSFRFEYPPAPTPKKRSSIGGKAENFKVLQDQQVREQSAGETISVSTDSQLKYGTNHDNIQKSLEKTVEMESKMEEKTTSPFNDLYQMIKKSLDVKTPLKSSISLLQTPSSTFCSPKPVSVKINSENLVTLTKDKATPMKGEIKAFPGAVESNNGTPKSVKKQRKSSQLLSSDTSKPETQNAMSEASVTPQRETSLEVSEQVASQTSKSTVRKSKEATPAKQEMTSLAVVTGGRTRASPRNSGNGETVASKKRKSGEPPADLPMSQMKRKRVSFGGNLSPELFDKRMPPNSPLRKGATPRRSFCLSKPKDSLLRRVSVIGMIQEHPDNQSPAKMKMASPKKSTSKKSLTTQSPGNKTPKSRSPSPKAETPGKKTPKSRSPSPTAETPGKKPPKSRSPSPKAETPGKKTPKSKSPSPKVETPGKKTPKSRSPSPTAETPGKKTPKSRSPPPNAETPGRKTPKSKSPSPKAETPGKKTPKSRSPSPKAETPGKKTPKSRSPAPKAETPGKKTPKSTSPSPTAETPGKKTLKSRSPSPRAETPRAGLSKSKSPSPGKRSTPRSKADIPGLQTPTIKGRFSVSRICTPSPNAESGDTNEACLDTVTPKLCLKRKSMKSTSRKSALRSSVKVMCRKSGISQVSMKAMNSWAEIVKFGQKRAPVGGPVKAKLKKTTVKRAMSKPHTPASKLKDQVSTGHADSPVTIVVGRSRQQKISCPTGAAPRWISNVGVLKKDMKMDEDLTGISEMYKTPVAERKQRPDATENTTTKTPVADLSKSVVEPSVLNTPEEPGEMMISPLSVSTTVKDRSYNHEAVQRLFIGEHESILSGKVLQTPKQKIELQECLTAVKRIMKTPREKAVPLEDIRGNILKTPKQRIEQQECLTGVKRIMKTPRQKAEPLEDLRGKILKTPKQKIEQQECLTGIKRIMKTPREKAEPLEDIRGHLLKTPKQKIEPQECLTGVKKMFSTPQQAEDPHHKHLESHEAASSNYVDLPGRLHNKTPPSSKSSPVCLSGVKRLLKTPRVKVPPVEDMVGVKRLLKTPREKGQPVADNFGIKRLMKSPKLKASAPVEDFEGLKELMKEPLPDPTEQEKNEVKDEPSACAKGADENEVAVDDNVEQVPYKNELSDTRQITEAVEESEVIKTDDSSGEKLKLVTAVRGRRARMAKAIVVDEQKTTAPSEEFVISARARGRRGGKTEATAPPVAQRSTRRRNAKSNESSAVEGSVEQSSTLSAVVACKHNRSRNAKKASDGPTEIISKVVAEAEIVPEPESDQTPTVNFREANGIVAAVEKPRGGRRTKQPSMPEKEDVPLIPSEGVSHAGKGSESKGDFTPQPEVLPSQSNENNPSDNMETVPQELAMPSLTEEKEATQEIKEADAATSLRKSSRVRTKVELRRVEDHSENPIVDAGISKRGRNAKITEQPTVRQTRRNAKLQECKSEQEKIVQVSEVNTEVVSGESSTVSPNYREAATKSTQGRKTNQALTKPLQPVEVVSKQQPADDKPEKLSPTHGKNTRGKRTKTDDVHSAASEEREQTSAPSVRTKRGRFTKQASVEVTTQSRQPVKSLGRTRKVEQDPVNPSSVLSNEQEISKESEGPVDAKMATRPRRAQKTAKDKPLAESDDVLKTVAICDKPKYSRRGKQVVEIELSAVTPEEKPELEADDFQEQEATVGKRKRVKNDVPEAIQAKRTRRGATIALVETNVESPDLGSKELPKRGRRAAKPSADVALLSEELKTAVVEDAKLLKRSAVKWKRDIEVFDIQKTPVKVQGRKSKVSEKNSSETEEKALSDKVEVQVAKRTRRGVKIVESNKGEHVDPETQPKTRRGQLARK